LTNSGTSTSAVLGVQSNPTFSGTINAGGANFTGLLIPKPNNGGTLVNSNDTGGISVRNATSADAAAISFHRPGIYALNLGLDTDNGFKIGGWSQGSTPYFQINTSGHVQKPYQPAIWLDGNYGGWVNEGSNVTAKRFNVVESRGGISWDAGTGRVTVPVSGWYSASWTIYLQAYQSSRRYIRRNGTARAMFHYYPYGSDCQSVMTAIFYCAANDYIDFLLEYGSSIFWGSNHSYANVQFLG
jgi:hypothetical protein